jgi:hypothetical protein
LVRFKCSTVSDITCEQKNHIAPQAVSSDLVARFRRLGVGEDSDYEENDFGRYRSCHRIPKRKAGPFVPGREKGQVRPVRNPVKKPVADDPEPHSY